MAVVLDCPLVTVIVVPLTPPLPIVIISLSITILLLSKLDAFPELKSVRVVPPDVILSSNKVIPSLFEYVDADVLNLFLTTVMSLFVLPVI